MKKHCTLILAALLVMSMMFTACEGSEFGCTTSDDKNAVIEAKNAGTDSQLLSGTLEIAEGDTVTVDCTALESGSMVIDFIPAAKVDDPDEAAPDDIEDDDILVTLTVSAGDSAQTDMAAGGYMFRATPGEKATGTVTIKVEAAESKWTEAASTDEAGEKAGVGLFLCDPQGTSLGPVINADYHYMEGVAEAHYGIAAVDMYVHKGLKSLGEDVSFDTNKYAHEWTHEINGTEVKCFGNREGEATKTIWTTDEYAYSITAYGAGGDTDYGLSMEDLETVFKDLQ